MTMKEAILILVGCMAGGIMGVVLMCMFQINTINKYEGKLKRLKRELEESRHMQEKLN